MPYKGSIELISGITPMNGKNFPIANSENVYYENSAMNTAASNNINNVKDAMDYVFSIINSSPTLTYVDQDGYRENEKVYYALGDSMTLVFNFSTSASGKCTYTILRNGISFRTVTANKGIVSIDLGTATSNASYTYTVSAIDGMGRDAENILQFKHIIGGVTLTSTFDNVINTTVFSANQNTNISIPYSISYPEEGYLRKVQYSIVDSNNVSVVSGTYECGMSNSSSSFTLNNVNFTTPGTYKLALIGIVVLEDDTETRSQGLLYKFSVISENSIAITVLNTLDDITTSTVVSISYNIVTNIPALTTANTLASRCSLYKINDDNTEVLIKSIRNTNLSNGDNSVWNIGRLSNDGNYRYVIAGEPMGGQDSSITSQYASGTFEVISDTTIGTTYVTDGLVAYFDPNDMDNSDENPSVWKANGSASAVSNYYYFKLHNLNYNNNGWIVDNTDGSKMLKFTSDSYGELRYVNSNGVDSAYSPISEMTSSALGNSLEIVFKTRSIGINDAVVMSCRDERNENHGGYSIYTNGLKISSNSSNARTSIVEEKETHVVFVIDKNIRNLGTEVDNSTIEDMNPVCTMNIYVNGVRTKVVAINSSELFGNSPDYMSMQMLLNAYYDTQTGEISGSGSCEIKTVRIYNVALKASQVLNNFINSKYDLDVQRRLVNKNDANKADIPIIRFVRNKVINGNTVSYKKYSNDKPFNVLNNITVKSSKDPSINTSKNSWVNCTMWYTYIDQDGLWKTVMYPDVDVYLQGTSSLQFPVKNYKIKIYNSSTNIDITTGKYVRGGKLKIIPPNKSAKDGWFIKDNVFTLKCDYMEESHRNNTPTAMMYEDIVANVVSSVNGQFTPAKRDTYPECYGTYVDDNDNTVSVKKYRDAIAGFPVLLYYNDNDSVDTSTGTPVDYNSLSNTDTGYYVNDNDVMVGTLMFNIDKTGGSIGFAVKELDQDGEQISKPVLSPITGTAVNYTDNTPVTLDIMPCVSVEGSSNSAKPSAASFYTLEEANKYTYKEDYLTPKYNALQITESYETFYQKVQNKQYTDIDTYAEYCERDDTGIFKNVYDYITATFEVRWSYTDESLDSTKTISDATYNELTYGHIKKAIDWIATAYNNESKFRTEFSQHFSLAYCITYYLQMMMFIQVDNAGKNAMFDQWGDGVLYPRPYDMDTQVGENNSGEDVIHVSAEINTELSPAGITGTYKNQASTSNMSTFGNHTRFIDYNTPNSKLWIAFGKYFKQEISEAYAKLRNDGIYTTEHIVSVVNSLTSDIIGESFYNKDAAAKYLSQTQYVSNTGNTISIKDEQLPKLQGNRESRYHQVIDERIIFLDTFFGYTGGTSINKQITIRSDALSAGTSNVPIGISVYSPCYITIQVGTDVTIRAYIDTDETYTYNSNTYEGVLFNLPIVANNKDIIILGAGNIKAINHMENLVMTNFICGEAKKLTAITITNSTALASLSLGANTYLRKLNLNGSTTLGGTLDLTNCHNLKTVDIGNTKVSSVAIPTGGDLSTFIATNCSLLTNISFNNLYFLNTIDLAGCVGIVSYEMQGCPLINTLNMSGWTRLNRLVVSNCTSLQSLDLSNTNLAEISVTSCDSITSIDLSGCNGTVMKNLNLSTIYGLTTLNISNSQPSSGIVLYFPVYKKEYSNKTSEQIQSLINDGVDVYWHTLTSLNANSSTLKNITYGTQTPSSNGDCDFAQLTNLSNIDIRSCHEIIKVLNLKYTGSMKQLFYGMQNLTTISGKLTSVGNSAESMFYQCVKLTDISNVEFVMDTITYAYAILRRARSINYTSVKKILSSLINVTNLRWFLAMDGGSSTSSVVKIIDNTLFENNIKVTTLDGAFYNVKSIDSVPDKLFNPMANTLTDISNCFASCSGIATVPNGILKDLIKLKTTSGLFRNCTNLTTYFTDQYHYDIFPDNNNITSTEGMFYNCNKLNPSSTYGTGDTMHGIKTMFDKLTKVENCNDMFYNTMFITELPDVVFENATELKSIDMMFASNINLTGLPSALFSDGEVDTTTHSELTSARGLFSGCTSCAGTIQTKLLYGANNLTDIGHVNGLLIWNATRGIYSGGMFANTAISGYAYNFLEHLKKLTSVSMLFFKGNCSSTAMVPTTTGNNNESLTYVYIGDNSYPLKIYHDIFAGLTNIKDARYCFAGNTGFTGFVDYYGDDVNANNTRIQSPNIFKDSKNVLNNIEGIFANCINLEIEVPKDLFKNCTQLTTIRSVYAGCSKLTGSLPNDFLSGCTKLTYADYAFYGCSSLGKNDTFTNVSIPCDIFDSCRNTLVSVSHMFEGCGFTGRLGSGIGERIVTDTSVSYNITKNGLLAECVKLISTKAMFRACKELKGKIPEDIFFTHEAQILYTNLIDISYMFDSCHKLAMISNTYDIDARNTQTIYSSSSLSTSDRGYLVPQNWLNKCPNITTIDYLFNRVSHPDVTEVSEDFNAGTMDLADTTFSQQTKIQTADRAFAHCKSLNASLTSVFMQNCLNSLTNVERMFAFSMLKQAGSEQYYSLFEKNSSISAVNDTLTNMKGLYYGTGNNNMTGYGPTLSKFTAITSSNSMVYNQVNLSNYNTYTANQKSSMEYYDASDIANISAYNETCRI